MCRFSVIAGIVALLLAGRAGDGWAQGYGLLSGRNHPELRWEVAETEHFRIVYPSRLVGIEAEAAPIAEATYRALSANLDVTFDRKIDIYLSDEDEIVNGIAFPVANGYTTIWVHAPEFARTVTGPEKWLRFVIAHELTHVFHYRKVLERPKWLAFVFGDPLPRFWTEGLAQYESESWTAMRGDRWLRTAVLDDRLSYSDGQSLWNGRLMYAIGNAQLRYLTERRGDSTLVDILEHRKPALFGLAAVHDFETAFAEVTGDSYRSFYDEWRRHVNAYYNSMAAQLENVDSLGSDPLRLPGQYYFDVAYSPDTSHIAVHALTSLERPIQRLFVVDPETDAMEVVAEGSVQAPVAWSPDGRRLAYARLHRGRHGSFVRDLYLIDRHGTGRRRLTHDRGAGSPAFSPDGTHLAFAANDAGTENIYVLDLATSACEALTSFDGSVQISSIRWHPDGQELLFDRFREDGRRDIAVMDIQAGSVRAITPGDHDDRDPVYSPDGTRIAYTSLRDDIPNVFILDRFTGRHERATNVVTGAAVTDWLPADSLHPSGTLIVVSAASKSGDRAYRIDAERRVPDTGAVIPEPYAAWTRHRPPSTIPTSIAPDGSLITRRYAYRSSRNLRHVASLGLPYFRIGRNLGLGADWGVAGLTAWIEPLGKHTVVAAGGLSLRDPLGESYALASYVNNQWHPSISLNLYRLPGSARMYGDDLLVEAYVGGDVSMSWPLDWSDRPYATHTLTARLRLIDVEPLGAFDPGGGVAPPTEGQQSDLRIGLTWRTRRPYWNNLIHPLDGLGVRLQLTGAMRVLGTDAEYVRADVSAYGVFPGPGLHRLFVYGRAQGQAGRSFKRNYLGFSRYDAVRLPLPAQMSFLLGETERVRGYRSYALGNRMLFGSVEYRVPLLSGLRTTLLGVASLGSLAGAVFVDAGQVWSGDRFEDGIRRVGVGAEVKNALRLGGGIRLAHGVGVAQPAADLGTRSDYEIYYRVQTTLPF